MTFHLITKAAKHVSRREIKKSLAAFVKDIPSGSKVLNIGAGGSIMNIIKKNLSYADIRVHSTDIDPARIPDIIDDITATKIKPASYDYIVCAEVLEHVTLPHQAVANLFKILKSGGKCLVTTPYLFPTHDAPLDHFRYTEFGLRFLFGKFEILSLEARTLWWETLLLLMWRTMWMSDFKVRLIVWFTTIILLPLIPFFYLFSRNRPQPELTAGFITELSKPNNSDDL